METKQSVAETDIKMEIKSESQFSPTLDSHGQFSTFEADNKEDTR
jgi:hypothetical protein